MARVKPAMAPMELLALDALADFVVPVAVPEARSTIRIVITSSTCPARRSRVESEKRADGDQIDPGAAPATG